ncbi:MAG: hypothetical protein QM487_07675 [Candidatus Marithrix sp.]
MKILNLLVLILLSTSVFASEIETGEKAFQRGNFKLAVELWVCYFFGVT